MRTRQQTYRFTSESLEGNFTRGPIYFISRAFYYDPRVSPGPIAEELAERQLELHSWLGYKNVAYDDHGNLIWHEQAKKGRQGKRIMHNISGTVPKSAILKLVKDHTIKSS